MHCRYCGYEMQQSTTLCPRCGVDLSRKSRRHRLRVSVLYVLISLAFVGILLLFVLNWHAAQLA